MKNKIKFLQLVNNLGNIDEVKLNNKNLSQKCIEICSSTEDLGLDQITSYTLLKVGLQINTYEMA